MLPVRPAGGRPNTTHIDPLLRSNARDEIDRRADALVVELARWLAKGVG